MGVLGSFKDKIDIKDEDYIVILISFEMNYINFYSDLLLVKFL